MDAPEAEALADRPAVAERSGSSAWRIGLTALSLSLAALALVYFDTFRSMAAIWSRSDTYVHGWFVLPISLYLIWTVREEIRKLTPWADARALAPLALAGFGWLAARLGGVLVAEQYFAVAAIPLLAWALLGPEISKRILFPLGYLLLAVPVGEALIPHMIDYTAAFAVAALRLSGVPVHQEGNLLTLPNSQWSVVEACSGLRYLIACVTIGLVFAYLTYRSWARRAAFIALSIVVPIVANWVRAYLIIFIGYTSDMKLAVGVDHLIYGWIFYAVVMCLLLWVGSLFSDHRGPGNRANAAPSAVVRPQSLQRTVFVACAAVLAAALWPVWAGFADSTDPASPGVSFAFPRRVGDWTHGSELSNWQPHYVGASFTGGAVYEGGEAPVGLHVALYPDQRQGAELVSSANKLVPSEKGEWRQLALGPREVPFSDSRIEVEEWTVTGPDGEYLAWKWYWIAGRHTSSPVRAKLIEASEKLRFQRPFAAGIVLFTEGRDEDSARERLQGFLTEGLPAIESALEDGSR